MFYNNAGERCSRQEANLPEEDYSDNFHVLTEEEEEAFKQFEEEQKRLVGDDTGYDSYNLLVAHFFCSTFISIHSITILGSDSIFRYCVN